MLFSTEAGQRLGVAKSLPDLRQLRASSRDPAESRLLARPVYLLLGAREKAVRVHAHRSY
jgi:hypothetical protein